MQLSACEKQKLIRKTVNPARDQEVVSCIILPKNMSTS